METVLLPLPYKCFSRPEPSTVIYDSNSSHWSVNKRTRADIQYPQVFDNLDSIRSACDRCNAECHEQTAQSGYVVAKISGQHNDIVSTRNFLLSQVGTLQHLSIPLESGQAFRDANEITVRSDLVMQLNKLAEYTNTAIVITRIARVLQLNIYGYQEAAAYCLYKCRVLLDHLAGYTIRRMELPLSLQPLLFGPNRAHLSTIFQQTNVNVYGPCFLPEPRAREHSPWPLDEVYLAGDSVQVCIAEKMLNEILEKTDTLIKSVVVPRIAMDILRTTNSAQVKELMTKYATFIQLPPPTAPLDSAIRVMGVNRSSIEQTIEGLMRLCMHVYSASVSVHTGRSTDNQNWVRPKTTSIEPSSLIIAAGTSGAVLTTDGITRFLIEGESATVKAAIDSFSSVVTTGAAIYPVSIKLKLELSNQLKDFLAGKKSGKVLKIMSITESNISFEPLHEYNFQVTISADNFTEFSKALNLLENELPAEKYLYIPEPYHKQVIGAGGSRIQSIMRNHNVYIKFGSSGDKIGNAFGNLQIDNVLIRCPAKNANNLERAATDLQNSVEVWAKEHLNTFLRLTRSQRRFLSTSRSGMIFDIEKQYNAIVKLPKTESKETELLEITGLGVASQNAANDIKNELPTDYEFRVAHNSRFADAVGPNSSFATRITGPFRVAFGAQVQAFERVQMHNDNSMYAQIVVTSDNVTNKAIEQMSRALTIYLREHGLDIIDKGELSIDPIVQGTAAVQASQTSQTRPLGSINEEKQNQMGSQRPSDLKYLTPFRQTTRSQALSFGFFANQQSPTRLPQERRTWQGQGEIKRRK